MPLYGADLALIHHEGFGDFARGAAPALLRALHDAGLDGGLVVDLGCGSGIWLRELLRAGHAAVGVDASRAMLALARTVAPAATLRAASAFDFVLPPCAAVTALGEALNYAPEGRQNAPALGPLFRRVARALPPGGLFVFDLLVAGKPMNYRTWTTAAEWAVLIEVAEDVKRGVLRRDITIFRRRGAQYRRSQERHTLRVHDRRSIERELRRAGFSVRATRRYGDYVLAPRRLAFWARRARSG
jgi:SAM-dependent methyltransferase